jgi:hypothetical protein
VSRSAGQKLIPFGWGGIPVFYLRELQQVIVLVQPIAAKADHQARVVLLQFSFNGPECGNADAKMGIVLHSRPAKG